MKKLLLFFMIPSILYAADYRRDGLNISPEDLNFLFQAGSSVSRLEIEEDSRKRKMPLDDDSSSGFLTIPDVDEQVSSDYSGLLMKEGHLDVDYEPRWLMDEQVSAMAHSSQNSMLYRKKIDDGNSGEVTAQESRPDTILVHDDQSVKDKGNCPGGVCSKEEFLAFFMYNYSSAQRIYAPEVCAAWNKDRPGNECIDAKQFEDFIIWAGQHHPNCALRDMIEHHCEMKFKKIRMNDTFKAFLVKKLKSKIPLQRIQKRWNAKGQSDEVLYSQLYTYMQWAAAEESSDEIKQLALQYIERNKARDNERKKVVDELKDIAEREGLH